MSLRKTLRPMLAGPLLAGLMLASVAHADTLSDLRAKLGSMQATQPLAATLSVKSTVHDDKDASATTHAQLKVSIASGKDGLHIGYSPKLLKRAAHEATVNAGNKDAPSPIQDLLGKLSPIMLQPMVDFAPALLRQIDGATLDSQSSEVHDGKPSQLLVFKVPLPASASKEMTIKHYTGQIKVWLGADGVPVEVENVTVVKARKLLISINFGNTSRYTLGVIGSRLVVLRKHSEQSQSVFGHGGNTVTDTVLTPVPASADKPGA